MLCEQNIPSHVWEAYFRQVFNKPKILQRKERKETAPVHNGTPSWPLAIPQSLSSPQLTPDTCPTSCLSFALRHTLILSAASEGRLKNEGGGGGRKEWEKARQPPRTSMPWKRKRFGHFRLLYLLFRPLKGYEGSLIKLTPKLETLVPWTAGLVLKLQRLH